VVLQVAVLLAGLATVVVRELRLVNVVVHAVLSDRAVPAVTHGVWSRIARANVTTP
jgi:hypothetical protein